MRPAAGAASARSGATVDPAAGYWLRWDGLADWPDPASLGQTVVTWTSPPAPSHKHADELSILVWSKGVPWLTSVGYWPYDDPSRADAESWSGANAPQPRTRRRGQQRDGLGAGRREHGGPVSDRPRAPRARRVPGTPAGRASRARHLAHRRPCRYRSGAGNQTVWQLAAEVAASRRAPGSYQLVAADRDTDAQLTVLGSAGTSSATAREPRPLRGVAGRDSVPKPAPAITVDQPPGDAGRRPCSRRRRASPAPATRHDVHHAEG